MPAFLAYVRLNLIRATHYRKALLLNLASPLVVLLTEILLWEALFRNAGAGALLGSVDPSVTLAGYDASMLLTQLLLVFVLQQSITWSNETELAREIRDGRIVARTLRPTSFLAQNIASTLGSMLPQLALNLILLPLLVLLAQAIFGATFYVGSPRQIAWLVLTSILGTFLRLVFLNTYNLLCFFTTSHLGLSWTRQAITEFFSGAIVPLSFFPPILQSLAAWTPFPLMLQFPLSLYLGLPMPLHAGEVVLLQLAWMGVFLLIHRWLYRIVRRHLEIAGG